MHRNTRSTLQRQRGFTLMEILVAVAIFATVMIVALLLYDRSNRVFKTTNEAAEMQQNTRVAYEKVVADLRMAGFDYKRAGTPTTGIPAPWVAGRTYSAGALVTPSTPNGHVYRVIVPGTSANPEPAWTKGSGDVVNDNAPLQWQESGAPIYEQPDEQIEFAHTNAITLRANFDYGDVSTPDKGRETDLENSTSGRFPMITTGNDEIVTYALVSRSGHADANKDSVTFYADVNPENTTPSRRSYPGGSPERLITIPNVDLTNKYPPYTLMRYTIGKDGKVVETALADNIRSLSFQYWEDAQATRPLTDLLGVAVPNIGGSGMYDPAKPNEKIDGRIIRGKIRAMTASIVGMNPQPDQNYTNATDTVAPKYRQYALQSTVVGRNLGLEGIPQTTSNPPGPPTVTAVCTGYCGVAYLTWKPAEGTTDTTYTVLYDTSSAGSFSGVLPAGSQTSYAVDLTQLIGSGTTFYFRVAATNANGTTLSTNFVTAEVKNATKPNAPTGGVATNKLAETAVANQVVVMWQAPIGNASGTISCSAVTPSKPDVAQGEIKGFRLYRSRTAGFDLTTAGVEQIVNEDTGGPGTDGSGLWRFVDTNVENCEKYYYRVQAVEWCAASAATNTTNNTATAISDLSAEIAGDAYSETKPKQVQNLKIHPDSACDADANRCYPIRLTWDKVLQDVSNTNVLVRKYDIYRQRKKGGAYDGTVKTLVGSIADGTTTWSEPTFLAYADPTGVNKYSYEYTVHARYGNTCGVTGDDAVIVFPDDCNTGATIVPNMTGPGSGTVDDPWQNVDSMQATSYPTKPLIGVEVRIDGGPFNPLSAPYFQPWSDSGDGQIHNVTFRLKTPDCTELRTVYIQDDAPSCDLTGTVVNTTGSKTRLDVNLVSSSSEVITIDDIAIQWAGQTGLAWNSITLPSGTTAIAAGTAANARTATFTPTAAADRKIDPNATHKLVMNFSSAGASVLGSSVAAVRIRYTIPSTGTIVHDCAIPLTRCAVTGSVAEVTPASLSVAIQNPSTEQLSVNSFAIGWSGHAKLAWSSVTLPNGTIVPVTTATTSGTQTFTLGTAQTVNAGSNFNVTMNFVATGANPTAIDAGDVTDVVLNYTTPTSGSVTMTCRVK